MASKDDRLNFEAPEETAQAFRALAQQYDDQAACLEDLLECHAEEVNDSSVLRFYPRRRDRV
jgi:hypothetical protein